MSTVESKFVEVDGVNTHYLEAGPKDAPTVGLLHSGEFGGCSEISWEFTIPALAQHFHVLAADWLGFGRTDKVYDFADQRARVYRHMARFYETMGVEEADFIGNSMGGSNLARMIADPPPPLPVRSAVLCSGGGFTPLTDERKVLLDMIVPMAQCGTYFTLCCTTQSGETMRTMWQNAKKSRCFLALTRLPVLLG